MNTIRYLILATIIGNCARLAAQSPYENLKEKIDLLDNAHKKGSNISDSNSLKEIKELRATTINLNYFDLAGNTSIIIGKLYKQLGMMSASEQAYKDAINFGQRINDSLWLAMAWGKLGDLYSMENRNFLSLESHFNALSINEKYDITKRSLPENYNNIAKAYIQAGQLRTAETYLDKSLALKRSLKDTTRIGIITTLRAEIFRLKGQFEKAEEYYLIDIPKRKRQNNFEGLVISFLGLGDTYFDWGKYDKAISSYKEALNAAETIQRYRNMGLALIKLGNSYQKTKERQKAKEAYYKAIAACSQVDSRVYLINAYQAMYQMNKEEGNINAAVNYLEKYMKIFEINTKETQDIQANDLKAAYQLKKKESELATLDIENKKTKQIQSMLIAGMFLLVILSCFLVLLFRSRNKALKILNVEQENMSVLLLEKENLLSNLHQTHHKLVHSEKMASLGVMTAGIAHEINNPVSSIHASAEAIQMDVNEIEPILEFLSNLNRTQIQEKDLWQLKHLLSTIDITYLSTELKVLLGTLTNSAQRTSDIIRGLKTFSRDDNESKVSYKIEDGIDAALTILKHKMDENLIVYKSYEFRENVVCHVSKINQVLLNILDNAIHAIPKGGIIKIETKKEHESCHIFITDNGEGMDENTQKKVFEPFYTTKDIGKGTGLGLSISYAIIAEHDGTIDIQSELGKGTTFHITIPIALS